MVIGYKPKTEKRAKWTEQFVRLLQLFKNDIFVSQRPHIDQIMEERETGPAPYLYKDSPMPTFKTVNIRTGRKKVATTERGK